MVSLPLVPPGQSLPYHSGALRPVGSLFVILNETTTALMEEAEHFQKFHSLARYGVNISVTRKPPSHSAVSLFFCPVQILLPKGLKADLSTLPSSFKNSVPFFWPSDRLQSPSMNLPGLSVCLHVCVCGHSSCIRLFATSWTVAHQAPLSLGFSRKEYWSGLPRPPPEDFLKLRDRTHISCIVGGFFTAESPGEPSRTLNTLFIIVAIYVYIAILWCTLSISGDFACLIGCCVPHF